MRNFEFSRGKLPPGWLSHGKLPLRITFHKENCPRGKLPPDNYPLDDGSQKITPKIIAAWQYPSGNCLWGKLLFGWFVAYIIPPRKTAPRNIVPRINYTRYIFSFFHDISCFPSLWFNLVLDFDFCKRKNFMKTVRLKLLKNEEQIKKKLIMEYWKRIVYAFVTERD